MSVFADDTRKNIIYWLRHQIWSNVFSLWSRWQYNAQYCLGSPL